MGKIGNIILLIISAGAIGMVVTVNNSSAEPFSYTGRMAENLVEIANTETGEAVVLPPPDVEGYVGDKLPPLSAASIKAALMQETAQLQCAGYEPYFDIDFYKNNLHLQIGDISRTEKQPQFVPVTGLSGTMSFQTSAHTSFGTIEIGSWDWSDNRECSYGLADDDGMVSYISIVYSDGEQALGGCCQLVWNQSSAE